MDEDHPSVNQADPAMASPRHRSSTAVSAAAHDHDRPITGTPASKSRKGSYTWRIPNFLNCDNEKIYSECFEIGKHTWRLLAFPRGRAEGVLSVYLDAPEASSIPANLYPAAQALFKLIIVNQVDPSKNHVKEASHTFGAREPDWGFTGFISLAELEAPNSPYVTPSDGTVELRVEIQVADEDVEEDGGKEVEEKTEAEQQEKLLQLQLLQRQQHRQLRRKQKKVQQIDERKTAKEETREWRLKQQQQLGQEQQLRLPAAEQQIVPYIPAPAAAPPAPVSPLLPPAACECDVAAHAAATQGNMRKRMPEDAKRGFEGGPQFAQGYASNGLDEEGSPKRRRTISSGQAADSIQPVQAAVRAKGRSWVSFFFSAWLRPRTKGTTVQHQQQSLDLAPGEEGLAEAARPPAAPHVAAEGVEGDAAVRAATADDGTECDTMRAAAEAADRLCQLVQACSLKLGQLHSPKLLDEIKQHALKVLETDSSSMAMGKKVEQMVAIVDSAVHFFRAQQQERARARLEEERKAAEEQAEQEEQKHAGDEAAQKEQGNHFMNLVNSAVKVEGWRQCGLPQPRPINRPEIAVVICSTMMVLQDSGVATEELPSMDSLLAVSSQVIQLVGFEPAIKGPPGFYEGMLPLLNRPACLLQMVLLEVSVRCEMAQPSVVGAIAQAAEPEAWQLLSTMTVCQEALKASGMAKL